MKICVFGSGNKKTPSEFTDVAYELGARIALENHSLVFGGGNNGIMGAVARGVLDNGGNVLSIAPKWIDDYDDEMDFDGEYIRTDTLSGRKKKFLDESDVFIIAPGGIGTFDEFFEVLVLKYLHQHSKKVILFNLNHYYDMMVVMLNRMHDGGFVRDGALEMLDVADTIDDVFALFE